MIAVEINGINYSGWLNATLTMSITDLCGTFSFSFTDLYRQQSLPAIRAGLPCTIYHNGVLQKTGYIDAVNPTFNPSSVTFSMRGRDKSADLVDCSLIGSATEFKNISFEAFVNQVCSPFGIKAQVESGVNTGEKIESVKYEQGSTVYEVIKKEAQKRQLLIYSKPDGDLIIGRAGSENASLSLVEGENIISGSGDIDASQLYSEYIVKGDKNAVLADGDIDEVTLTQITGKFLDNSITRNRPLIIIQNGNLNADLAGRRARWEATSRIGASESYTVTVQGWHNELNKIINLRSKTIYTSENEASLLVTDVELNETQRGETTTFTLVPLNAFIDLQSNELDSTDKKGKSSKYQNRADIDKGLQDFLSK